MDKRAAFDGIDKLIYTSIPYMKDNDLDLYHNADRALTLTHREKNAIARRAQSPYDLRPFLKALKRASVILLIVSSLAFASAMTVKAVREAVWEIIVGWYEEYIRLDFSKGSDLPAPSQNEAAKFVYKEPRIDEGYERYVISQKPNRFFIEYEKGGILITYCQEFISDARRFTSNNDTVISEIKIGDNNAYAFTFYTKKSVQNTIMWVDGTYYYSIGANLPLEELKAIAETIE